MVGKLGCQQYRGAPLIVLNSEPSWDHRNYNGPAAHNPYYGTCTSPTRERDVRGFDKWFQTITVGPQNNCVWPSAYSATEEGAQEALCIVQECVPEVKILAYRFVGQDGGPFSHAIELPDGMRLNAGLLLDAYYQQGWGGIPTPTPLFASRSVGRPTRQRQRGPPRSSIVHFVFVGRTSGPRADVLVGPPRLRAQAGPGGPPHKPPPAETGPKSRFDRMASPVGGKNARSAKNC